MENAVNQNESKRTVFDEAMKLKIIEREKEIDANPDKWIDGAKSIKDLRESL